MPSEVTIIGPKHLQAGIEKILKCKTDESYPASKLIWRVDGIIQEDGVNASIEYTESGGKEAWSELVMRPDDASDEVTVTCEVESQDEELRDEKMFKVKEKCWELLIRGSSEEEFSIPEGFVLVDIDEENIDEYTPEIQHLVTAEVTEQLRTMLAGFARSKSEENCMTEDGDYSIKLEPLKQYKYV